MKIFETDKSLRRNLDLAFKLGDWKTYQRIMEDWLTRHRRMPKGHRLQDRNPDMHMRVRQRHMTSEKAMTGMTGKQLRKARKRAMKARKAIEART